MEPLESENLDPDALEEILSAKYLALIDAESNRSLSTTVLCRMAEGCSASRVSDEEPFPNQSLGGFRLHAPTLISRPPAEPRDIIEPGAFMAARSATSQRFPLAVGPHKCPSR